MLANNSLRFNISVILDVISAVIALNTVLLVGVDLFHLMEAACNWSSVC